MNLSDHLLDEIVRRDLAVSRFESDLRRRTLKEFDELRVTLHLSLQQDIRLDSRRPALHSFLQKTRGNVTGTYDNISRTQSRDLLILMKGEIAETRELVERITGSNLLDRVTGNLKHARDSMLIQGALIGELWKRQAENLVSTIWDEVRRAISVRSKLSDLVTRVIGTRSRRFRDGALNRFRRSAVTLGITSVNRATNDARMLLYRANADVIRGLQAVAVLDSRTSDICKARAGGLWNMETGAPLPGSPIRERFPGPPPWHYRCRTTLIPVLRKQSELEKVNQRVRARVLAAGKANFDGTPAEDLTFGKWLERRSVKEQEDILGPGRFELWKKGSIRMQDLIDQSGRPLTLDELSTRGD